MISIVRLFDATSADQSNYPAKTLEHWSRDKIRINSSSPVCFRY